MSADDTGGTIESTGAAIDLSANRGKRKQLKKQRSKHDKKSKSQPIDRPIGRGMTPIFFLFIAAGGLTMWFASEPQIHFFVSIGLTVLYGMLGKPMGWLRGRRREIYIDSCYFLGFIFTQLALVLTFLRAYQSGVQSFDAGVFVSLIATALGASVAGLIIKFLYDQSPARLGPGVDEIRQGLASIAGVVREETVKIAVEVEGITSSLKTASAKVSTSLEETSEVIVQMAGRLRSAIGEFDSAGGKIETHEFRMNVVIAELSTAVAGLKSSVEQAGVHAHGAVSGMADDLGKAIELMGDLKTTALAIQQLGSAAARESLASSAGAHTKVQALVDRLEPKFNDQVGRLGGLLGTVTGRVEGVARDVFSQAATKIVAELRSTTGEIARLIQNLELELQEVDRPDGR